MEYLMKKLLLLLLISTTTGQAQQFNGTVYDLDSGRIQIINGSINEDNSISAMRQRNIESYRRISAELSASIDAMRQESEMRAQTEELRKQTRLLRQLANE